jgi:site-specific DNA-cytosine methylase
MRALDLFCGGGGVSVGLSWLGFDVVGVDNDRDALATHEAAGHRSVYWDLCSPYVHRVLDGRHRRWSEGIRGTDRGDPA